MKLKKLIQTQNSYHQKKRKRKIERNPDGKWVRTSEACHTRWVERMTMAPWLCKYLMVGTAARILVSSVMLKLSSKGTLRSTLTNTLLPFKSACFKVLTLLLVAITAFKKNKKKNQHPDHKNKNLIRKRETGLVGMCEIDWLTEIEERKWKIWVFRESDFLSNKDK